MAKKQKSFADKASGNKNKDSVFVKYVKSTQSEETGGWRFNEQIIQMNKGEQLDAALKRLDEVAKVVCLDKLISSLPMGYDEIVGERGNRFSGGQIQRIGLARAIFKKNPLIILDEATSGLDLELEQKILSNIKNFCKGSSLIMITHRIESTSICDKIIKI